MKDSVNYKRLAGECLRMVQDIKNPTDRALLVAMAESWLRLAEQAESREAEAKGNDAPSEGRSGSSRR
jgi:hypothetical protein